MTEPNKSENGEQQSIYLGNAIPKILRFAYVGFVAWAVIYLAKYGFPDLLKWLGK